MKTSDLASAAAAAADEGGTVNTASIIFDLARLSVEISNEHLQGAIAQAALECMKVYEQYVQKCLSIFTEALCTSDGGAQLAADSAWAVHKLTQRHDMSRWLGETLTSAVYRAILAHATHSDLVNCSIGILYNMKGISGLGSLLEGSMHPKGTHLSDGVLEVIIWTVCDDIAKERLGISDGAGMLNILVQLLAHRSHNLRVQKACCTTLASMVYGDARFGGLLVDLGGIPLIIDILRNNMSAGDDCHEIASQCVRIIVSLAEASSTHAAMLNEHGGVQLLLKFAMLGSQAGIEEKAMIAVGNMAGVRTVLQAMSEAPTVSSVMRGGLDSIAELLNTAASPHEVEILPGVLEGLWTLLEQMTRPNPPVKCRKKCLSAICSTMVSLAPHAEPGQVPQLDQAVKGLLHLQTQNLCASIDFDIAANTIEALGRLMLVSPAWRAKLKESGAEEIFVQRIQAGQEHQKLLKYVFWAAAALSGLPFVCRELRLHLRSEFTIDAAFCSIIDILDDDVEGDWVLSSAERCTEQDVPVVLSLIAEAMHGYMGNARLQSRGCHCIGLLLPLLPKGLLPPAALTAAFDAARRHASCPNVMRDAMFVLRALLETVGSPEAWDSATELLCANGAEAMVRQALKDHGHAANCEVAEEAVAIVCFLSGPRTALELLYESSRAVQASGIKAVAECGRHRPQLLRDHAHEINAAVIHMANGVPDEALQQNAALLVGLCSSYAELQS
eukprot:TRINITY_DN25801_c0_g1_i1.p1 TRINITY_DN25801_c0_g1~~TRINITY_DN25801_c0_g1_i1.p1  ORF type:complete len:728 (+),score=108.80 TRINITY_DN25801_c0_g1_i1:46-2229(+)